MEVILGFREVICGVREVICAFREVICRFLVVGKSGRWVGQMGGQVR